MRCRPISFALLASVSFFAVATGCGEKRQTAFLWDHDTSAEPAPAEPELAPEADPSPEPEPEPEPTGAFDVERWGVITGGDVQCIDAASDREATHLVFGDQNDLLVVELGPDFDLRWDFALRGSGIRPSCASGLAQASFRVVRYNENTGSFGMIEFDADGNGNELGGVVTPPLSFLDAEILLSLDDELGLPGVSLVTGFAAPDFGPGGIGATVISDFGAEISGISFADSYERQIGAVFDFNFGEVIYAYSSFGTVTVSLSRFPEDFGEPIAQSVFDISLDPFLDDFGNRNRLTLDDRSTLWLAAADRLVTLDRNVVETGREYALDPGAEASAVVSVGSTIYVAATLDGQAVVYRFRPTLDDNPTVAYRADATTSSAFDLKRGVDDALHFVWVERRDGAQVTTVDVLTPR